MDSISLPDNNIHPAITAAPSSNSLLSSCSYESFESANSDETLAKKSPNTNAFKTLFKNITTPRRNVNLKFKLDTKKQAKKLVKGSKSFTPFSMDNFVVSPAGISASLANIHPITFKNFESVIDKFCGGGINPVPKCEDHDQLKIQFTRQINRDKSDAKLPVAVIYAAKQFIGSSLDKFGAITLHYTTRRIQVQATAENVTKLLAHLISPLMNVTANSECVDLALAKCLDCAQNIAIQSPQYIPVTNGHAGDNYTKQLAIESPNFIHDSNQSPTSPADKNTRSDVSKSAPQAPPTGLSKEQENDVISVTPTSTPSRSEIKTLNSLSPIVSPDTQVAEFNRLVNRTDALEKLLVENTSKLHSLENHYTAISSQDIHQHNAEFDRMKANEKIITERLEKMESTLKQHSSKIKALETENDELKKTNSGLQTKLAELQNNDEVKKSLVSVKNVVLHVINKIKQMDLDMKMTSSNQTQENSTNPFRPTAPVPTITHQNRAVPTTEPTTPPNIKNTTLNHEATTQSNNTQTAPNNQRPDRNTPTPIKIIGGSNLGKISNALRNTVPGLVVDATPGSTFDHVVGAINLSENCDVMVIQGGVNEANSLDDVDLAREPLKQAIEAAKCKAKKVILMPPPPLSHPRLKPKADRMTDIMWYEARNADVEFVNVAPEFEDERIHGKYVISRDTLHVTKLGGGIYAWALLNHLDQYHKHLKVNTQLCANCQLTTHKYNNCDFHLNDRSRTGHRWRAPNTYTSQPPTFVHYNRFNVLQGNQYRS